MKPPFEFATANRIVFGTGKVRDVPEIAADSGQHALLVSGKNTERSEALRKHLVESGITVTRLQITGEPKIPAIEQGISLARKEGCDLVLSMGGGSVIDSGKAVAAMLTNSGELLDYLEVVGRGKSLQLRSAQHIAIPTTAGTGAEVTRNAVIESPRHHVKVSMRSPHMLPQVALIDPELTLEMPPEITASTGLDALTQLLEAFVTPLANPVTDGLCREGLRFAGRSLHRAFESGDDLNAREEMSLASCFSGIALANAKLGAVHGFAGPLGGRYPAPHGMLCARLAPPVMRANLEALRARTPESPALERYAEASRILTGNPFATAEKGMEWLEDLTNALKVPGLSRFGVKQDEVTSIVEQSEKSSSMKGNPVVLNSAELRNILLEAL